MKDKLWLLLALTTIIQNLSIIAQNRVDIEETETSESIFGTNKEQVNNLTGKIYYLPAQTQKLPNFDLLTPVGEIHTPSINVENQDFNKGFPGVDNRFEYFAIKYEGQFYIKDSSNYLFTLGSDDGSKLLIDDKLLIDNDFQHALIFVSNSIFLVKGMHKIELQYFQGPKFNVALILKFKKLNEQQFKIFNLTQLLPISIIEKDSAINIAMDNEILFDFNSCELNESAKYALHQIKEIIIDKTIIKTIEIEGHTDNIGSDEYNMALSLKRARIVKDYLENLGINQEFMKTKGYGELNPIVPNSDANSRKKNRRIELTILKQK